VGANDAARKIYVANYASNSLSIFPLGSNGNVASLFGSNGNVPSLFKKIQLSNPTGIAYHADNLYVADHNDSITVYPANATGRPNTIATIHGSNTHLNNPGPIAVDAAGTIYAINVGAQGDAAFITIYAAGSNGNVAPKTMIAGPATRLDGPTAIAADAHGNIYLTTAGAQRGNDSILIFSAGSSGNASPARIISGAATRVRLPAGIAVNAKGYIYVTTQQDTGNNGGVEVLIFAPGASGNIAPVTGIDGDCDPKLGSAGPIALDADGRLYLATTELMGRKIAVLKDAYIEDPAFAGAGVPPSQCGNVGIAAISGWGGPVDAPYDLAVDPAGNMYIADPEQNTIQMFPAGANGSMAPAPKFNGDTGIIAPTGVALDTKGTIYAANDAISSGSAGSDNVSIYPPGSNANVSPVATITNISEPQAIAIGSDGTVFVADGGGTDRGSISVFFPASGGKGTIVSGIDDPSGLATDHDGNLYVINSGNQSITVYGPRANGETPPIRIISGEKAKLNSPVGIAVDAAGKIYVTNNGSIGPGADSITVYAPASSGNVAPIAIITGPKTKLKLPQGIAIDSDGKIYVANDGNLEDPASDASRYDDRPRADPADSITVYASGSNGNVAPIARINGALTGLGHPMGIAVGP
jgi:sugar lactone lactonase YvrE